MLAAVAGLAMIGGGVAEAAAFTWATKSAPLTATGYGSTGVGYGTWNVSSGTDGTRSRATANLAYYNADNHKVFYKLLTWVNAGACLSPDFITCDLKYYQLSANGVDSNHYSTASKSVGNWTWIVANGVTEQLPGSADYARGELHSKLDIPLRSDISSPAWLTKGKKY
jgi:hypothetical protein